MTDLSNMTPRELLAQKTAIQAEERRRKLTSDDYRIDIRDDLKEAKRVCNEVSTAYQYGGPTMHSVSHHDLTSVIWRLERHVTNLLWLLDNV